MFATFRQVVSLFLISINNSDYHTKKTRPTKGRVFSIEVAYWPGAGAAGAAGAAGGAIGAPKPGP